MVDFVRMFSLASRRYLSGARETVELELVGHSTPLLSTLYECLVFFANQQYLSGTRDLDLVCRSIPSWLILYESFSLASQRYLLDAHETVELGMVCHSTPLWSMVISL